jgi:sterol desaturase/sphingolipid hydroxylase (fatty acid hydroxylase superfamily)
MLTYEIQIRLGVAIGLFVIIALIETILPRRNLSYQRGRRWPANIALVFFNSLVIRLLFPVAAVGFALICTARGWGVFNLIELPTWLEFVGTLLLLDLLIYGQHIAFHYIPWFWRLHAMHHADQDFDVSTGGRFHPGEVILSMLIKFLAILLIGPAASAVIAFEVLLNASSTFNHANIALPKGLDRYLRLLLVTPDMHRVHHSSDRKETNSNFGFFLPWWDRLFGTYRAQPALGHDAMQIGLLDFRAESDLALHRMIAQPFRAEHAKRRKKAKH